MSTGIDIKKKLAILNEGASITTDATSIDFVGSGVNSSTVGNNVTVTIPGGSGTTTYYLNQSVTQTPYKEFSSVATTAVEQVVPLTVSAGATSVIAEFQTPIGVPNTTQIPGGLWQFFLHFNAGAAGQNWIIRPTVYKRDLGGIETLLFTTDPEIVTNMSTTTTMYTCDGVFPATTLVTTDRIVVRISMQNTTGVSQTVSFRTEGSQHYSVGLTTLNQIVPTGAVTSVTGTAPIVSSGGTTPAISIPLATGSANGYLSSSDWSTFSAKLGGSGTINRLSKWTSSTDLGNSLFEDNGISIGLGTTPSASIKLDVYSTLIQSIRGVNGSTSVGNKTAIEGTANGANGTNIGGYFYAQNGTNNYSIWLNDGTAGVGKVLTSMTADGKANWATPSGVTGSGTTNYLSKFTGSGFSIGDSIILDNGTVAAIGNIVVDITKKLLVLGNAQPTALSGYNTYAGSGNQIGVDGQSYGTGTGKNVGVQGVASTNSVLNIGVSGFTQGASIENIGGKFAATGATSNYSLQLTDGTEGVGKFLKSITADGKAQWATIATGLTYFTEAQSTAAPNNLVNVDSLTAIASTTNADFAIIPKGTGATLAQIPDGTAIGGNKRGAYAIDFQRLRPAATYVASGSYATILNGQNNTASGNYSFSHGLSCNAAGAYSFCFGDSSSALATGSFAFGTSTTASGGNAVAFNGTASGTNSFSVAGGTASGVQSVSFGNNLSSSDYTFAQGSATTASGGYSSSWGVRSNTFSHASRKSLGCLAGDASINASGYAQRSWLNVATNTTTATPKSLNSYNGTPTIALNLQNNNAMRVKGSIIGKQTASTNVGAWDFDCVIVRGATAGTTVIAGTPTISLIVNTGGFGNPTLTANTSEGGLDIKVTGLAGVSINWNGTIDSCETIIA